MKPLRGIVNIDTQEKSKYSSFCEGQFQIPSDIFCQTIGHDFNQISTEKSIDIFKQVGCMSPFYKLHAGKRWLENNLQIAISIKISLSCLQRRTD